MLVTPSHKGDMSPEPQTGPTNTTPCPLCSPVPSRGDEGPPLHPELVDWTQLGSCPPPPLPLEASGVPPYLKARVGVAGVPASRTGSVVY